MIVILDVKGVNYEKLRNFIYTKLVENNITIVKSLETIILNDFKIPMEYFVFVPEEF